MRHLFPLEDDHPHAESASCPCSPTLTKLGDEDVYVHHFADGREIIFAVEVMLGMRCPECGHYINEKGEHCEPPPPYYEESEFV